MTTRAEHLQWCKDRALAYVSAGLLASAVTSMINDLTKHEQTTSALRHYRAIEMGMEAAISGDQEGVIHWIRMLTA